MNQAQAIDGEKVQRVNPAWTFGLVGLKAIDLGYDPSAVLRLQFGGTPRTVTMVRREDEE